MNGAKVAMVLSCWALGAMAQGSLRAFDARIAALEQQLQVLNRELTCQADEDCQVLPVGAKECGGPNAYLVASAKNSKFKQLIAKLDEDKALHLERARRFATLSSCDSERKPYPRCIEKTCAPTFAVNVDYRVHTVPRVSRPLDVSVRLGSQAQLEALWLASEKAQNLPTIDFEKSELLPWEFCRQEPKGLFYFSLRRVEDVGVKVIATYVKMNACKQVEPRSCGIELAEVPKLQHPLEVVVSDVPQRCDPPHAP